MLPKVLCALARELGFIPVEVNASDTRNKADKSAKGGIAGKLANNIKELADNRALTGAHGEDKRVALALSTIVFSGCCSMISMAAHKPHLQATKA